LNVEFLEKLLKPVCLEIYKHFVRKVIYWICTRRVLGKEAWL
jgi:hypothetical protein